ncbi:hypothetical protein [Paenibacillus pabuli]|uniref:hypothetical protein n=1 Tax=Paenibacillus pabuli TaxID=1472 RepID=UPI003CF46F19
MHPIEQQQQRYQRGLRLIVSFPRFIKLKLDIASHKKAADWLIGDLFGFASGFAKISSLMGTML